MVAEIPGPPGVVDSPPLFAPDALNDRLWHIPFNRVNDDLTVQMVRGNEDAFYRYEFAISTQDGAADDTRPGDRRSEQLGARAGDGLRPAAKDVRSLVIPGAGHWVAEQAPKKMLAALNAFLAPNLAGFGGTAPA